MYIFSFRSRTQSLKYYDTLRSNKIPCNIINTPRQVSGVCGLSVSVENYYYDAAKKTLGYNNYDSFLGIFEMND